MKTFLILYGKPRYLGFLKIEEDHPLNKGDVVVVETTRGQELGVIAGPLSSEQEERYRRVPSGDQGEGGQKVNMPTEEVSFIGFPLPEEAHGKLVRMREESAILLKAREMLKAHNLTMKLVDVEYLLDRSKLFFYFTAEQRIDFRGFVRDLAREFKTRIELRQIGGRDEAKVAAGISQCGMPCCCSTWLNRFEPICIKMVKQQNLALNPTKISGICGRLMCCMGYEHTTYQELWKGLPNPGTKLKSLAGETYLISGVDLMGKSLRVFCPDRTEVLVPVAEFAKFRESIQKGEAWEPQREEVVQLPFNKLLQEAVSESETILEDGTCPPEKPARPKPVHVPARERFAKRTAERTSREIPDTSRGNIPVQATPDTISPPAGQESPRKRRPRRKKRKNPAAAALNESAKQSPESRGPITEPASSSPDKTRRRRNSRRRRPRKPSAEE